MTQKIVFDNFNLGGIADSKYQGQQNSVAEMVGFDIHSEPGILKHNQKLTKDSGSTVDELCKKILACSDGNSYYFSCEYGAIFRRTSGGTWSKVATVAPTGNDFILDAWEYQGYIYYSMPSRLGRVAVGAPTDWTTRDDNWATFTNTNQEFHPMQEVNAVLYIGDGKDLAQVDAGVFTASALDLKAPTQIRSLGKLGTDLLIGTYINSITATSRIRRWNTWSEAPSVSDDVPEIGVNSFLKTDNFCLVSCGTKGHLYLYDGSELTQFKKIPGEWTGGAESNIWWNASCNMFGLPLFGLSVFSEFPAKMGIYSLAGYDRNYPKVLNLEWLISTGSYTNVIIGAIELVGTNLFVTWRDGSSGIVFGVDKLDLTAKNTTCYFVTKAINIERDRFKTLCGFVGYRSLPNDATIKVYYKVNYGDTWIEADTIVDVDRKIVSVDNSLPDGTVIEIKVESNAATGSNKNKAPEIEVAEFWFE